MPEYSNEIELKKSMKSVHLTLPEIKLVGITTRTNNKNEFHWETGKIFPCVQNYFQSSIAEQIPNRKKSGTTFCVYTNYESDFNGEYTYFIGEEVTNFNDNLAPNLIKHTIPSQTYIKFTNGPDAMPNVVREPWLKIWQMTPQDFGGERSYIADFEIYDERAADHQRVVLDIYIGIQK